MDRIEEMVTMYRYEVKNNLSNNCSGDYTELSEELDELIIGCGTHLSQIDNNETIKNYLMQRTKNYLFDKINRGELSLKDIYKEREYEVISKYFNDMEQKLFLFGFAYTIAGYESLNKKKDKNRLSVACDFLKISKAKYFLYSIKTSIDYMRFMNDDTLEEEEEKQFTLKHIKSVGIGKKS